MKCASCEADNPQGAKFCASCGTAMAPAVVHCASCGTEMAPRGQVAARPGAAPARPGAPPPVDPPLGAAPGFPMIGNGVRRDGDAGRRRSGASAEAAVTAEAWAAVDWEEGEAFCSSAAERAGAPRAGPCCSWSSC